MDHPSRSTFMNHEVDYRRMQKGPLVYLAVIFAALLLVLSSAIVLMPDLIETLSLVSGVVVIAAIVVLLVMFVKMRKI